MRYAPLAALVCLAGVTVGAYAPSLRGGTVYEDVVYAPLALRGWPGVLTVVGESLAQPVRSLDRAIRLAVGPSPRIGRAVSLALHLLTGLVLWRLALRVLPAWPALFAVGLFWLHPLQTEAVAYMAARGDLLVALCVLLGCLAMDRRWYVAAACCALLAMAGKEMGVTAWLLVAVWAWARGQHWQEPGKGAWALGAALLASVVLGRSTVAWWESSAYVAGQVASLGRLLLLWPEALINPHALTIDHDWTRITALVAWSGAAVFGIALVLCRGWARVALVWALCAALPRLVFPLLDGQHERHLYVTSLALSLATAALIAPKVTA